MVRTAIGAIIKEESWDESRLDEVLGLAQESLISRVTDEVLARSEYSIVEACLCAFVEDFLPEVRKHKIVYVARGDPVEFVYNRLSIVTSADAALDEGERLNVFLWKTGNVTFRTEEEFTLRAGALTCWARSVLGYIDRPVTISEVFLRDSETFENELSDDRVRQFVDQAAQVRTEYSASAKVRNFPARPDHSGCRFCPYKIICPEWQEFTEDDYDLEHLIETIRNEGERYGESLESTGGEVRPVYLCHVSDDKEAVVRPFARALEVKGIPYWLDEAELCWGDSLFKGINNGLATSDCVVCFISAAFLERGWPQHELGASATAEISEGGKRVLPIMVADPKTVLEEFPLLADKLYKQWSDGIDQIVNELERVLAGRS